MRIKHFGVFEKRMSTLNWESLINDEKEKPYFLPFKKEDYLLKVDTETPSSLTQFILGEMEKTGMKKIFSIGSGIASQEYQLKKFSNYSIMVSDYNSSVLRLKQFEIFDEALIFDALQDPLPIDKSWIVLFPRIDTEFDDHQLGQLFAKCHNSGITNIYFIPAELLSLPIIIAEIKTFLISIIKRKPLLFCGYARSLSSFKKIWDPYYELSKEYNTKIFFIKDK